MLYVLLVTYLKGPLPEELLQSHREWLYPQFERGAFLLSGGLDAVADRPPSAIALLEADSIEEAQTLVDSEPLFNAGAVSHQLVPFVPRVRAASLDDRFPADVAAVAISVGR
jgi:uncharacterized protein YciI